VLRDRGVLEAFCSSQRRKPLVDATGEDRVLSLPIRWPRGCTTEACVRQSIIEMEAKSPSRMSGAFRPL
jgi:hypothetical protein